MIPGDKQQIKDFVELVDDFLILLAYRVAERVDGENRHDAIKKCKEIIVQELVSLSEKADG